MASSRATLLHMVRMAVAATGKPQYEVAALVGVSPKHLSQMLNQRVGLSLDIADRVLALVDAALVLGITPTENQDKPVDGDTT